MLIRRPAEHDGGKWPVTGQRSLKAAAALPRVALFLTQLVHTQAHKPGMLMLSLSAIHLIARLDLTAACDFS